MRQLEGAQQTFVKQLMRRGAGDILPIQKNLASIGLVKTGDYVEKRSFSSTIWSNQASN